MNPTVHLNQQPETARQIIRTVCVLSSPVINTARDRRKRGAASYDVLPIGTVLYRTEVRDDDGALRRVSFDVKQDGEVPPALFEAIEGVAILSRNLDTHDILWLAGLNSAHCAFAVLRRLVDKGIVTHQHVFDCFSGE